MRQQIDVHVRGIVGEEPLRVRFGLAEPFHHQCVMRRRGLKARELPAHVRPPFGFEPPIECRRVRRGYDVAERPFLIRQDEGEVGFEHE